MLKKIVILSLLLSISTVSARAVAPIVVQKISYQAPLPFSVKRRMPHGAKSYFWGKFQCQSAGKLYGIHLFKADPAQGQRWEDSNKKQEFTLDIFEVRRTTFKAIYRLPFNYPSFVWGVSRVGVAFTWLDPQSRSMPLLQFDIWTPEGMYGDIGDNVYLAFSRGFKYKAAIRSLQFGAWRASDTSGQSNQLRLGNGGRVEIFASVYPSTGELTAQQVHDQYAFALHWDTKLLNFVPDAHAKRVAEGTPSLKLFMGLPTKPGM